MFKNEKSGNNANSVEFRLNIRTHPSPEVGTGPDVWRSKRPLLKDTRMIPSSLLCIHTMYTALCNFQL